MHKIRVQRGDAKGIARAAAYPLEMDEAPESFARAGYWTTPDQAMPEGASRAHSMWLGSDGALASLGVQRGTEVTQAQLEMALQGLHTETGKQVRRGGMRPVPMRDAQGRAMKDADGNPIMTMRYGHSSVDGTFGAPKTVSSAWAEATPPVRAGIEQAMMKSAEAA